MAVIASSIQLMRLLIEREHSKEKLLMEREHSNEMFEIENKKMKAMQTSV